MQRWLENLPTEPHDAWGEPMPIAPADTREEDEQRKRPNDSSLGGTCRE
jgi:hypothetical protein